MSHCVATVKRRTPSAVKHQHHLLVGRHLRPLTSWKTTELAKLKLLWPTARRGDLLAAFPNRTWLAIKVRAEKLGLHRSTKLVTSPNELREAVRRRAREDGIAFAKLGTETRCGTYFLQTSKVADLNKIGTAVEFFGGKLVIDWQDQ
jgi:hypothetical protein